MSKIPQALAGAIETPDARRFSDIFHAEFARVPPADQVDVLDHLLALAVQSKEPTRFVVSNESEKIVKRLLELGANPNGLGEDGVPTFHHALTSPNAKSLIKLLWNNGGSVSDPTLHAAASAPGVDPGVASLVQDLSSRHRPMIVDHHPDRLALVSKRPPPLSINMGEAGSPAESDPLPGSVDIAPRPPHRRP